MHSYARCMDILTLVVFGAAAISVGGAVFSLLFSRRNLDAELKSDVEELALVVDRLAKSQRRDRMARVRQGEKVGETPLGASQEPPEPPLDFADPKSRKAELRRRMMRSKLQ